VRIALGLEYDGTGFSGWQRQAHARSVQQALELALSRVADEPVSVHCAGRTDAGVHATHQVVHFDTAATRPESAWIRGVNSNLPQDVGVLWMREVAGDFHARFTARARRYRFVLRSSPVRPVLDRHRVSWTWKRLALDPMRRAAAGLLGEHDFTSFRAVACQAKHPVRTLYRLDVRGRGDGLYYFDVEANAFLHHMVRNLVGVLIAIGAGDRDPQWAAAVLAARDRTRAGVTAPGEGLYLVGVTYPGHDGLPALGRLPVFA